MILKVQITDLQKIKLVMMNQFVLWIGMLITFLAFNGCTILEKEYYGEEEPFWQQAGLDGEWVTALAIDSNNNVFVATRIWNGEYINGEIHKSGDNGDTWERMVQIEWWVKSIAINSSGHIFALSWPYIFLSTDIGQSWRAIPIFGGKPGIIDIITISPNDHIFTDGNPDSPIHRSTDNGESWTEISKGLPKGNVTSLAFGSSGHIFAGFSSVPSGTYGVFRSIDNGDNWTEVNSGLTNKHIQSLATYSTGQVVAGTNSGVFLSNNNGDNWTLIGLSGKQVGYLAINSNGAIIAGIFYKYGVFITDDNGESWTQINTGLTKPIAIRSVALNSRDDAYLGTYYNGVFRSVHSTTE